MTDEDWPISDDLQGRKSVICPTQLEHADSPAAEAPGQDAVPVTVFLPTRGWQLINIRELVKFRELIYFLTWRDVKVRYKQTLLGTTWAVLQPFLMMAIFTVVFHRMAGVSSGGLPYPLFACAGLLPWGFFAAAIAGAGNSVVRSERLITKVYFPRLAVPFAAVGAAAVDFLIAFGLLIVMMMYYRVQPGLGLLLVPAVFGAIGMAALGVGTLLAASNVTYRDFRHVIPFLIQAWMFATPSVYMQVAYEAKSGVQAPADMAAQPSPPSPRAVAHETSSGLVQAVLTLNPMTGLIDAFRACVLGGAISWGRLAASSVCAAFLLILGCSYFRRVEDRFADII